MTPELVIFSLEFVPIHAIAPIVFIFIFDFEKINCILRKANLFAIKR